MKMQDRTGTGEGRAEEGIRGGTAAGRGEEGGGYTREGVEGEGKRLGLEAGTGLNSGFAGTQVPGTRS